MDLNKVIGQNLRQIRIEKGIKQETVAKDFEVSTAAVSHWEMGEVDFRMSKLEKLAAYYEVEVSKILPAQTNIVTVNGTENSGVNGIHHHNSMNPKAVVSLIFELLKRDEIQDVIQQAKGRK